MSGSACKPLIISQEAVVNFTVSGIEQVWKKDDGTLLEFAESLGLLPDFSCRSGHCGSCKSKLLAGKVLYQSEVTAETANNEILLCCAVPASMEGQETVTIKIEL